MPQIEQVAVISPRYDWKPTGGIQLEETARKLAADLCTSAFVYRAFPVKIGKGRTREPGDALLFANRRGAIVQVKTRESKPRPSEAQRWLDSEGMKARSQGLGTKRLLESQRALGTPVVAIPSRCGELPVQEWGDFALTRISQ